MSRRYLAEVAAERSDMKGGTRGWQAGLVLLLVCTPTRCTQATFGANSNKRFYGKQVTNHVLGKSCAPPVMAYRSMTCQALPCVILPRVLFQKSLLLGN